MKHFHNTIQLGGIIMEQNSTTASNFITDYGVFNKIFSGERVVIHTDDIRKENWSDYYSGLLDMFRDYIENENFQRTMITIVFDSCNGMFVELTTEHTLINLAMWRFIIMTNQRIQPYHLFVHPEGITNDSLKKYIDEFCILPMRDQTEISLLELNNIISESIKFLEFSDEFALYFNNSFIIEDFVEMAMKSPEFNNLLHYDYTSIPIDQINSVAMDNTNKIIDMIKHSEEIIGRPHGLTDSFKGKTGIKPKQLREGISLVGIKPNGEGGIANYAINSSYINGGVSEFEWNVIDSNIGRQAQILSKKNTAESGTIARHLGLNTIDSKLYCNPATGQLDLDYDCHTMNFQEIIVTSLSQLRMLADRYYRLSPNGIEYNIGCGDMINENHPVLALGRAGYKIYLRSPITCASAARGLGICRKCYGELYRVMEDFNIGKEASWHLSAPLTQLMLSAKHLLEAKISSPKWVGDIDTFLNIDDGIVSINPELQTSKFMKFVISRDDINYETIFSLNDDDDSDSDNDDYDIDKEYITEFKIIDDNGEYIEFHTQGHDSLFFTVDFTNFIHKYYNNADEIEIPLVDLQERDIPLFEMGIYNDDMGNKLKTVVNTINLKSITESFTKDEFQMALMNNMIECGLGSVMSIHAEVIIMNQIRDKSNILELPDWDFPNNKNYQVLTLRKALETNPSITISMQADNIFKTLINPLSFKKRKPSRYDLFYHKQPQKYIASKPTGEDIVVNPFVKVRRDKTDN